MELIYFDNKCLVSLTFVVWREVIRVREVLCVGAGVGEVGAGVGETKTAAGVGESHVVRASRSGVVPPESGSQESRNVWLRSAHEPIFESSPHTRGSNAKYL